MQHSGNPILRESHQTNAYTSCKSVRGLSLYNFTPRIFLQTNLTQNKDNLFIQLELPEPFEEPEELPELF
jgi:hypothetical protein